MNYLLPNLIEPEVEIEASEVTGVEDEKGFREIFCVNEVPESEYPKVCYRGAPLLVVPGQYAEGKGLEHKLEQCLIVIQKKNKCFIYQKQDFFVDKNILERDKMVHMAAKGSM